MVYYYAGGVDITAAADFVKNGNITISTVKDASNTAVLVFNNNKAPARYIDQESDCCSNRLTSF